eukprot:TRINITY_DN19337_c0_g1_i1.p4 TRINITY_DN19337_c0_g1~~TRINITY_DN19337_c0_g1_i1.p4  ORF type:complete len:119 (-),score=11.51 TRINITY_DN19337_c0_g1_i1:410-766(-)
MLRKGVYWEQNDEVLDLLLKNKGIQYSQGFVWSQAASNERSNDVCESLCEIPHDCPPTYRGETLQRTQSLCDTQGKQPLHLDLKIAFQQIQDKKLSRSFSLITDSNHIPELIDTRDLE